MRRRFLLLSLLPSLAGAAVDERPAVDKRAYSLAHPTPPALMRELTTDRPDATESPFTVDPGHVQLELDFAANARDRQDGVRSSRLALAPFNVRIGLLADLEAGLFLDPYRRETARPPAGTKATVHGVGDTVLRVKLNLWGNDGGPTACGVFADCKLPTAARALGNDKVEGALTVPVAIQLGGGWDLGAMTVIAAAHDGTRYQPLWTNTLTLGRDLFEAVGAFFEVTSQTGDGPHVCTFDTGLTWHLNRNTQLDVGVNLGASRRAADAVWFAGLSHRF